jgi:GTP cyclohydrolase I
VALADRLTQRLIDARTLDNYHRYDELVVAEDVAVHSLCAHYLLRLICRVGG